MAAIFLVHTGKLVEILLFANFSIHHSYGRELQLLFGINGVEGYPVFDAAWCGLLMSQYAQNSFGTFVRKLTERQKPTVFLCRI